MQYRDVAVGEGGDRGGRSQHGDAAGSPPRSWLGPSGKGETEQTVFHHQSRDIVLVDNHRANWKSIHPLGPNPAVGGPIDTTAPPNPFPGQSPIQIAGTQWLNRSSGAGHGTPVGVIGLSAAKATGSMTRSQRHCIIEEEERRPRAGSLERMTPPLVVEETRDPQHATMMAGEVAAIIDQTAPVSGEQPSLGYSMEVAPWVDPVTPRHRGIR